MVVRTQIRVIYGDTDAMGHAYYGRYMRWFEAGRSEWFRSSGATYRELEEMGVFLPVVEAHCKYRKPAFYDDLITVVTTFRFSGPASLRFDYRIENEGELLATGYTVHVCMSRDRKAIRPPAELKTLLHSMEEQS